MLPLALGFCRAGNRIARASSKLGVIDRELIAPFIVTLNIVSFPFWCLGFSFPFVVIIIAQNF
jgi:hypothetical protein